MGEKQERAALADLPIVIIWGRRMPSRRAGLLAVIFEILLAALQLAASRAESHAIALRLAGKRSRRLFRLPVLLAGTVVVAVTALAGPVSAVPAAAAAGPNPLVVVYMENQSLSTVIGTGQSAVMPYLNSLWGSASTEQFTDYYAVSHPSFPNYAAMASGETQMEGDAVTPGQFSGRTVWDQLQAAGVSWGVYQEAVPMS